MWRSTNQRAPFQSLPGPPPRSLDGNLVRTAHPCEYIISSYTPDIGVCVCLGPAGTLDNIHSYTTAEVLAVVGTYFLR